jgi:hypothetical protein
MRAVNARLGYLRRVASVPPNTSSSNAVVHELSDAQLIISEKCMTSMDPLLV